MSTLSDLYNGLRELLFPAQCVGCGELLEARHNWICIACQASMPSTYYHLSAENPIAERLKAISPSIENATAQFFYIHNGRWRNIIHEIKYHRAWNLARMLGYWYGCELGESPLYQDIDIVVPVPLHRSRLLVRRYNQSEKIAQGIASALSVEMNSSALIRQHNNPSQVTRNRAERWENVQGIFSIKDAKALEGKHILLVDDVFTTGATIVSCIETIEQHIPDCRVSVATLAVSRKEIFGNAI